MIIGNHHSLATPACSQTVGNGWCRFCLLEIENTNHILAYGNALICCNCVQVIKSELQVKKMAGFDGKDAGCKGCAKYHYWLSQSEINKLREILYG